ncbi:MAG: hypothetical protein A4E66_01061 [Syntrophus sp. PtaB.Bin001]|nr:MAG: hypothetical protein A4E66_01061 [Syntrophus sp. PtaB.Bin001]
MCRFVNNSRYIEKIFLLFQEGTGNADNGIDIRLLQQRFKGHFVDIGIAVFHSGRPDIDGVVHSKPVRGKVFDGFFRRLAYFSRLQTISCERIYGIYSGAAGYGDYANPVSADSCKSLEGLI